MASLDTLFLYLDVDAGEGGIMKKVTNGGIGEREAKIWHFRGDVIFERSLTIFTICSILDVCTEFWIRFVFDTLESKHLLILSWSGTNLKSTFTF